MNSELLKRIRENWTSLGLRRQVVVTIVFLTAVLGVLLVARLAAQPSFALLYSGLEPATAGEVIAALEQRGVPHQVRASGIFVDSTQRDRLRVSLAAEGLPAAGTNGYELLDSLTGFGTTSQMFDATYKRAKEGELARTIAAGQSIKSARVHISPARTHGSRIVTPGTASVFVTPLRAALSGPQVEALQFLVASATGGLSPENVSVIDSVSGRMLSRNERDLGSDSDMELSETLRTRVERLLEARVGPGNAIVEVNVTSMLDRERVFERRFDPESRVAISSETTENNSNSNQARRGPVTVASNLPDGDATEGGQDSVSETETRERVNYEVSETTRETERVPGAIKNLSVAVLVNGIMSVDENGVSQFTERSVEELRDLEALVKSAVGFDQSRGDIVTLKSLEMPESLPEGTSPSRSWFSASGVNATALVRTALLCAVACVLGLLVFRPILLASLKPLSAPQGPELGLPKPASATETALAEPRRPQTNIANEAHVPVLEGEIAGPGVPLPDTAASVRLPNKADAVQRLREQMKLRRADSVAVLQSWVEDTGEIR